MSHDMQIFSGGAARSSAMAQDPLPRPLPRPLPEYRERELSIRVATMADLPALDALQKQHGRALGYFPTKQFEGYIKMGGVLVAEEKAEDRGWKIEDSAEASASPALSSTLYPLSSPAKALGYIISRDRYLKRDELGVIYQLCVAPGAQRKLVGATLVKEVFARSAYGCRLYCCWCAQDLEANHFWESLGFVPIAFRAGSTGKKRVHIFWQKRIAVGDTETKWWYPFQTSSGAIREDRVVFPIPPGTHWSEVRAVALPVERGLRLPGERKRIASRARLAEGSRAAGGDAEPRKPLGLLSGFRFASDPTPEAPTAAKVKKTKAPRAAPAKIDPKYLAAARELRDRWMERVNDGDGDDAIAPRLAGKYDVSRMLTSPSSVASPAAGEAIGAVGVPRELPALPSPIAA